MKMTQLAVVATIPVIEAHGLHTVIRPFIHDLNILATEVPIDGVNRELSWFSWQTIWQVMTLRDLRRHFHFHIAAVALA